MFFFLILVRWTEEELNEIKKEKEEAKLASIENQKKKQQKKAEKRAQAKKRKGNLLPRYTQNNYVNVL